MVSSIPGHSGTLDVVKENKRLTRCFLFYAVTRTPSPTTTRLTVFYSANLSPTAGMQPPSRLEGNELPAKLSEMHRFGEHADSPIMPTTYERRRLEVAGAVS